MLEAGERLDDADLRRIGELHVASIEDSLPALLGAGYAARLYAFLAGSEFEHLLVERIDGRVESVCVVSDDPGGAFGRIAGATFPWLVLASLRAVFARPEFWSFLLGFVGDQFRSSPEPKSPEITYIFTNAQLRGKQLGRRLVDRVDAHLERRGVAVYFVKTLDDPANRALGFYEREGFERVGTKLEGGRTFTEFQKELERG